MKRSDLTRDCWTLINELPQGVAPVVDPTISETALSRKENMHNLPKLNVPGYDGLECQVLLNNAAHDAMLLWWESCGVVISQQISIAMLPQTPQEFVERVFKSGYMMGWGDSRDAYT